ncbi:MAG: LysE family transporter [Anaerolineales bacterium]|nr:LysE family transporter [Anaerolineales bacterium]
MEFLLKGLVLGFSIAAPVGPIGVLCIRRTLAEGRAAGFVSGLGAATADAIYGSVAAFGLTVVSGFLTSQETALRLVGGAFLCYLGVKTLLARPADHAATAEGNGLVGSYASTFFLTLTNPMTIFSFIAVFTGLGFIGGNNDLFSAAFLVLGVFGGSAIWWLLLSGGVSLFRARFDLRALRCVNWISGIIITTFGALALWSLK